MAKQKQTGKTEGDEGKVTELSFPSFDQQNKDRQTVVEARRKAAAIERAAYEKGFAKGEAAGIEMGLAKAMPSVEAVARLVESLDGLAGKTLAEMEPKIIELVLAIAERVIRTTIAADNTVLQRVVKAALQEVDERWEVVVKVNPAEYEFMQQHQDQWLRIKQAGKVKLIPDAQVEAGGCIVQSPQVFIDATLSNVLARVAQIKQ